MHQPGRCLIDKYFGSGMHLERAKAEITPKQRAAGPSPHPTFPECHLLPVFLLAHGCTDLGAFKKECLRKNLPLKLLL